MKEHGNIQGYTDKGTACLSLFCNGFAADKVMLLSLE